MKKISGKVAVVTGAASGIGRGIAESLLSAGAKVVLSDVEGPRLDRTRKELASQGEVVAIEADVSKFEDVAALAARADEVFGGTDILCNNAGVGVGRVPTWESTLDDWRWIIGVNLMGVVHGVKAFVPGMIARGEIGAIVNTASMAGLGVNPGNALYGVTKHGVVALTESLHIEFQARAPRLQAHVLCPGFVATNIMECDRNRPAELDDVAPAPDPTPTSEAFSSAFSALVHEGMAPREVGDRVVDSIRERSFYILTHPWTDQIETRMCRILDGKTPTVSMPPGLMDRIRAELTEPKTP